MEKSKQQRQQVAIAGVSAKLRLHFYLIVRYREELMMSGGDACRGHTRSHPEHDGQDLRGRWYYVGDDMGEQVAAGLYYIFDPR